jgi:hypothetical protein
MTELAAMLAIEASNFARGFAVGRAFFQIGALIARHFSLRHGDLGFQFAVFPMQIEKDKGASAYLGFAIKFIDFGAVKQKFAHSFG